MRVILAPLAVAGLCSAFIPSAVLRNGQTSAILRLSDMPYGPPGGQPPQQGGQQDQPGYQPPPPPPSQQGGGGYQPQVTDPASMNVPTPQVLSAIQEERGPVYIQQDLGRNQENTINAGPADYSDLIEGGDSEFDGGDGQMGVLGDGQKGLEKMGESTAHVIVKESKSTQVNAFGRTTGYADTLKDEGMVKINLAGEDEVAVRRQQLENWRNQQELRGQQRSQLEELSRLEGIKRTTTSTDYLQNMNDPSSAKVEDTFDGLFESRSGTVVSSGPTGPAAFANTAIAAGDKVDGTIELASQSGRPGTQDVPIANDSMGYEPFRAAFTSDSPQSFTVSPSEGTLAKRGQAPQILTVQFSPGTSSSREPQQGKLVVETEESKWTFLVIGSVN